MATPRRVPAMQPQHALRPLPRDFDFPADASVRPFPSSQRDFPLTHAHQKHSAKKGLRDRQANLSRADGPLNFDRPAAAPPAAAAAPLASVQLASDREFFEAERQAYVETLEEYRGEVVPKLERQLREAEEKLRAKEAEKDARQGFVQRELAEARKHAEQAMAARDEHAAEASKVRLDVLDLSVLVQTLKDRLQDVQAESGRHQSALATAQAALKAREGQHQGLEDALCVARRDIDRFRMELASAQQRESQLADASAVALQDTRAACRRAEQDSAALQVQLGAVEEARTSAEARLAESERTVLGLKLALDKEREKVVLQREFMAGARDSL